MQLYTILFLTVNALHVSGGFSAYHQELKNCTHSIGYVHFLKYNQQYATLYNIFYYCQCSTCFERFSAHHQELKTVQTASGMCV